MAGIMEGMSEQQPMIDPAKEDIIERETPDTDDDRKSLVKRWITDIQSAKLHWKDAFDKMKKDMRFAAGLQWGDSVKENEDKYIVNLVQRHIQQRTSSLYAKNPKVVAKRRTKLDYVIWDGDIQSLQQAMMAIQQATATGQQPPQEAIDLMEEVSTVKQQNKMFDKMGKTAEILFTYYMDSAQPVFKIQAKQLIRRVETCGVGYIKMGFNRAMDKSPELKKSIADIAAQIAVVKQMTADLADGKTEADSAEHEELEQALTVLHQKKDIIIHEGLVFDFPKSTSIIPSISTTSIKGWHNTDWLAQEFFFTKDEIKQIYEIDIGTEAKTYQYPYGGGTNANGQGNGDGKKADKYAVYEVQHKDTGMVFTVCDGYPDYLKEPAAPQVSLPRFYNIYSLSFNDLEMEDGIFPPSDVTLLRPMQLEYNRSREGLREHRIANRPAYVSAKGRLDDADKTKLTDHASHEVIEINISGDQPIGNVIMGIPKVPIDPAVYDTTPMFQDIEKSIGAQQANLGGTSGSSATEVSVAEGSRMSTVSSNVDDLDDLLCELAVDGSRIMFQEVSVDTAKKIAGAGAVWTNLNGQEVADMLYLEVKAGSSGRPNKAQDIANFERLAPTLLQIGGINPAYLAKEAVKRLDDGFDIEEALLEGAPSMIAANAMQQPSTGNPATDPKQQGGQGGNKAGTPNVNAGGQASHPAPQDAQTGNINQ